MSLKATLHGVAFGVLRGQGHLPSSRRKNAGNGIDGTGSATMGVEDAGPSAQQKATFPTHRTLVTQITLRPGNPS